MRHSRVYHHFKFGRLAQLAVVLTVHPCIQAKPRFQWPIHQRGKELVTQVRVTEPLRPIRSQSSNSRPPGIALKISRASQSCRAIFWICIGIKGVQIQGHFLLAKFLSLQWPFYPNEWSTPCIIFPWLLFGYKKFPLIIKHFWICLFLGYVNFLVWIDCPHGPYWR